MMRLITNLKTSVKQNPVLRSVGVYTSIMFLTKGISFLLLFIYTNPKFIEPSENGLLNLFASSVVFLTPFLSFGILQSTSTDYYKLNKNEFRNFFTSNFIPPLVILILSVIGLCIFREYFQETYEFPFIFALLIPLVTFLTYINEQLVLLIRINGELKKFAYTGIAKIILEFGLSVVLVVFFAMHWQGRLTGILVSYTLLAVYAFYYFYQKGYLSGKFYSRYIKDELIYAIPIIIMQLSIFSLSAADKFFLAHFTTTEVVGIYSIACIFCSIINLLSSGYLYYLTPTVYKMLANNTTDQTMLRKSFFKYAKIMIIGTLIVIIIVPFIYKFFINSRYYSAVEYFYLIALGYFIWSLTSFFHAYLIYYKLKRKLLYLAVSTILISLPVNYFFISKYGVVGAGGGLLISYCFSFILTLFIVKKYVKNLFIS